LATGHRVVVLDDLSTGRAANLPASNHLRLVQGDVLDRSFVEHAAAGVDLALHLAAVVGVKAAHADPSRAYYVSSEGTTNVLKATGRCPILLMSSSAVYGLGRQDPAEESEPLRWQHALQYDGGVRGYACGKQRMEQQGNGAMAAGRDVMILRPFNIVGPRQSAAYGMVLPTFLQRARERQPLLIHDDGEQTRCFGDVHTFGELVMRLLELPSAWERTANPINIGACVSTKIRHLAEIVVRETASNAKLERVPFGTVYPGKCDVRSRRPDTTRLESLLGAVNWPTVEKIVQAMAACSPR
jgi:UDP-glucose 4-epimerase